MFQAVEIASSAFLSALMVLAGCALAIGVIWYWFTKGRGEAEEKAALGWKNAYESERAQRIIGEEKITRLAGEITKMREAHEECEEVRREISAFNLRLIAREERYQEAINRLERRLSIPITNFNDPTQHITDAPHPRS